MSTNEWDIVGYVYKADLYCAPCILEVCMEGEEYDPLRGAEDNLNLYAVRMGISRYEESTFDSDDFPKVVMRQHIDDHACGHCGALLGDQ